ncbi:MAG: ATP-binding protein [Actinobacteria bacterium]|nr:ATP-binding protein [Actinomycetota bacterium]MBU1608927.1 ATP-binding protein [Actinomycetota bacterium]MBU2316368.1 ATP-binding protein [Actinomycetota bacterium]MBU2384058.1 ATP-binding protein [Actinomycetota bacterium]
MDADSKQLPRGPNQATEIVQLARARYNVVRGEDGKSYAVAHDLPGVAFGLRGAGGLRQQLAAAYFDEKRRAASGSALQDALAVLEGDAMRSPEARVHLRTGRHEGAIIIDRATPNGHAIKITAEGHRVVERSPILFRRSPVGMVFPEPKGEGSLEPLRELLNVDDAHFRLVVAYAVSAWIPDIAHPILALTGQQGTAKTTAARMVLGLIDPSAASLMSQPRNGDDWAVTAHNAYAIGLDNVSRMQPWLQDALCKAVTGDAFVRRELYSDDSLSVLHFRRPIALTTIDPGALQGDVADRLLQIELQPISPTQRRTEAEVQERLESNRVRITSALLQLLSAVLRELPTTNLREKPRMADFALVLAALDSATGWSTLPDYLAAAETAARDVVDGDTFATAVVELVSRAGHWEGTCLDLLEKVSGEKPPREWPGTPRAVAAKLARFTPALIAAGIDVHRREERTNRGAIYELSRLDAPACAACGRPLGINANASTHGACAPTLEEPF